MCCIAVALSHSHKWISQWEKKILGLLPPPPHPSCPIWADISLMFSGLRSAGQLDIIRAANRCLKVGGGEEGVGGAYLVFNANFW